jgi:hypothetical protein
MTLWGRWKLPFRLGEITGQPGTAPATARTYISRVEWLLRAS